MHLAFDDHRIDDGPEVVRGRELYDLDTAGLRINLDFAHIGPGRKREVLGIVKRAFLQARLGAGGKDVRPVGGRAPIRATNLPSLPPTPAPARPNTERR